MNSPPPRKQPKLFDLPVYSKSAHLVLKLEERNIIRNFFQSPVPFLAGADGVMMEIALRKLVGAECGNVADFAGSPQILEFQRKYYCQYRGVSSQPFEILTVLDEDEQAEMNRLLDLGIGSVPYPWGKLSSAMETEWESYPDVEELYDKKDFLTAGIHAQFKKPTIGNYSDINFTFPLPIATDAFDPFQERTFYPPYDLTLYFDAIGGQDWVAQRSDMFPSRFQYIKKSFFR
jgi:hypothetical protein